MVLYKNVLYRVIALLMDYIVLIILMFLLINYIVPIAIGMIVAIIEISGGKVLDVTADKTIDIIAIILVLIFSLFYYGRVFKKSGQTIGERIMKIKIVPAYGERISLLSGIIRTLFLAPLLAIIGFIPVSKNPYKSLLDHICLTKTVKAD